MMQKERQAVQQRLVEAIRVIEQNDTARMNNAIHNVRQAINTAAKKLTRLTAYVFPFVALLTVILLMYSNIAIKNRRDRRPLGRLIYITLVHIVLAFIKAFAFCFFILPGFYVYIKLMFVSLIMLEEDSTATEAVQKSWQMTTGNFWRLFLLIFLNTVLQTGSLLTIIGFIPATGFVNTARAAAYHQLKVGQSE